jgi:hypothetical protein
MKNLSSIKFFAAAILTFTFMSFTEKKPLASSISGTYGVCSSEVSSHKLELTLNEDKSFHYINKTNPDNSINISGTWSQKGNVISLNNLSSDIDINDKWTIDKKDNCISSRKGILWTRLCFIK